MAVGWLWDGCGIRISSLSLNFNFYLFWGMEFMAFISVYFMIGVWGIFLFCIEVLYLMCSA